MPENAAPDSTTPDSTAPDSTAPDNATPGQAAPGGTAPATAGPGEMSLYTAMLGQADRRLGWLLEGMMTAQVATVLARLAIPDEVASGPLTAGQLASRVGAAPGALERLLSAAAVYGLVRKDDAGRYALAPAGDLLRTDAEGSARGVAVGFLGPPLWQSAGRLEEIVRSPDPVNPARPGGIYEYYGRHPEEAAWFAQAMGRVTGMMVDQLTTAAFRPLESGRIVDVGGSRGTLLGPEGYELVRDTPVPGVLPWRVLEFRHV